MEELISAYFYCLAEYPIRTTLISASVIALCLAIYNSMMPQMNLNNYCDDQFFLKSKITAEMSALDDTLGEYKNAPTTGNSEML